MVSKVLVVKPGLLATDSVLALVLQWMQKILVQANEAEVQGHIIEALYNTVSKDLVKL